MEPTTQVAVSSMTSRNRRVLLTGASCVVVIAIVSMLSISLFHSTNGTSRFVGALMLIPLAAALMWLAMGPRISTPLTIVLCDMAVPDTLAFMLIGVYALGYVMHLLIDFGR